MLNNTVDEEQKSKSVDIKSKSIVNGYIRTFETFEPLKLKKEKDDTIDDIINIILSYYHDKLLLNTNIYTKWKDLNEFEVVSQNELKEMQDFHEKLIEQGYNKKRLPKYEMFRYYFGTSRDINRALNKWKGSIDTYSYYKLANITELEIKQCLEKLSKSCHFCGYHGIKIGKPSPVFVLNYEHWNWNDFDDLNHVIKASFYICCWMTDSIQAIQNGITLMINSTGVRFHHIKKAMSLLRAIQKSLALRTNNVFFLNLPSLAKNSMKLFLKIYPRHIQVFFTSIFLPY